jgi:tetratricopeptide (TPR) repeat protein
MALVAQGQYHQALAAFGKILEETPNDRFAVMETAKIYQTRLDDVDSAVEVLEKASAGEWPEDDKCFFLLKLADIHSTARSDFAKSREVLNQLILEFPDSRHAANAHHKLREIEEQEFLAQRQSH